MQADASVRIGAWSSVFQVALDRASDIGKLAANLVVPSCQQFDFYKVISLRAVNQIISQAREPGILAGGTRAADVGFVLFLIAPHHVFKQG